MAVTPLEKLRAWLAGGREIEKKAAPGPWILGGCSGRMITTYDGYCGDGFLADTDLTVHAEFIADARTRIVKQAAIVEALIATLEEIIEMDGIMGCETVQVSQHAIARAAELIDSIEVKST